MGDFNEISKKSDDPQPPSSKERFSSINSIDNTDSAKKLEILKESIKSKCNDKFPLLDKVYSPGSRVPCIDFTNWIIRRIEENDINAIKLLMLEIIGSGITVFAINLFDLGIKEREVNIMRESDDEEGFNVDDLEQEPEEIWANECIETMLSLNFNEYLKIDEKAIKELKAMFIIFIKVQSRCERDFWISGNAYTINNAMCVYPFHINRQSFTILIEKANRYVESKEDPYYKRAYSYAEKNLDIAIGNINENKIAQVLRGLPISSRLHFFDTLGYLVR